MFKGETGVVFGEEVVELFGESLRVVKQLEGREVGGAFGFFAFHFLHVEGYSLDKENVIEEGRHERFYAL